MICIDYSSEKLGTHPGAPKSKEALCYWAFFSKWIYGDVGFENLFSKYAVYKIIFRIACGFSPWYFDIESQILLAGVIT